MDIILHNNDCFDVFPNINDKSIDMILCDLPYGTTACQWDSILPFDKLWDEYKRIIKPNGAIVLTASQPFTSFLIMSNIDWFRYELVWHKRTPSNVLNAKKMPIKTHENILVFYNSLPTYNPIKTKAKQVCGVKSHSVNSEVYGGDSGKYNEYDGAGDRYPTSVIDITGVVNNSNQKVAHPTQKPIKLMEYLIMTYSNENETVLDNCMGSGTTGVACKLTNRKFIGIEKEPEYFSIAQKRIFETQAGGLFFNSNTSTAL